MSESLETPTTITRRDFLTGLIAASTLVACGEAASVNELAVSTETAIEYSDNPIGFLPREGEFKINSAATGSAKAERLSRPEAKDFAPDAYMGSISISHIGVDAPLFAMNHSSYEAEQNTLSKGVTWDPISRFPADEDGYWTTILFAHRTLPPRAFYDLDALARAFDMGETPELTVSVVDPSGATGAWVYNYQMSGHYITPPEMPHRDIYRAILEESHDLVTVACHPKGSDRQRIAALWQSAN